jgi:inosine-uridine nucleoside N-ribohydrolase
VPTVVDVDNSAAVKIIELVNEHGKNLNILTLSSLTNLSLAVLLENSLSKSFNRLYVSGGSALGLGNSGVSSEANFRCDPVAAKNVVLYYNNVSIIPIDVEENLKSKQFHNFGIFDDYVKKVQKEEKSILQILAAATAINAAVIEKEQVFPGDVDTTGKFSRGALSLIKYPWLESEKYNKVTLIESLSAEELTKILS